MPLTTPFLPLTVSASAVSANLSVFGHSEPTTNDFQKHAGFASPVFSAAPHPSSLALAHSTASNTARDSSPAPARPGSHSRRYTLSRFPLLRKGSRELTRAPSTHLKPTTAAPAAPAESPFLATGAPRASSSTARASDVSAPSEPADALDAGIAEEQDPSATADRPHPGRPDKMHQTSSRLLRMTDDERPYTRVSARDCCVCLCNAVPPKINVPSKFATACQPHWDTAAALQDFTCSIVPAFVFLHARIGYSTLYYAFELR